MKFSANCCDQMMKVNKEMDMEQHRLGMKMTMMVVLMMDMLIVMLKSQLDLFLNLARLIGYQDGLLFLDVKSFYITCQIFLLIIL